MDIHVSLVGRRELAGQIQQQIRQHIRNGVLPAGAALPSSRELARRLGVSRNTVLVAFDRLQAQGLIESRTRVGYFVCPTPVAARRRHLSTAAPQVLPRSFWQELADPPDMSSSRPLYDFRGGLPWARQFPYGHWRALLTEQFRAGTVGGGAYGDPAGDAALKAAIARHITVSRAVAITPEQIVVTSGAQQALDLVARVLLRPGDVVAVEDPGYIPAYALFRSHGLQVVGVPVDADGLVVADLPDTARLVYLTPSHQFPLGVTMSLPRRHALLSWAARRGAMVVEDDYDSEYRYAGRPLEPLQSLDTRQSVLYVGSFAKVLLPTLRLGFVAAPPALVRALTRAKFVTDWQSNGPMQAALAAFIDDGGLAKHIRRTRRLYERRHEMISSIIRTDFAETLTLLDSRAGLHMAALLPGPPGSDNLVVHRAHRRGVAVTALSHFAVAEPRTNGLMLGYGAIAEASIPEGLRRLRTVIADTVGAAAGRTPNQAGPAQLAPLRPA